MSVEARGVVTNKAPTGGPEGEHAPRQWYSCKQSHQKEPPWSSASASAMGAYLERAMGIGPTYQPWEGCALPLSYARSAYSIISRGVSRVNAAGAPASLPFCRHKPPLPKGWAGQPSLGGFLAPRWNLHSEPIGQAGHEVEDASYKDYGQDLLIAQP